MKTAEIQKYIIRVTRREFEQYTSKYLKILPIIVTMRGIDDFIVKEVDDGADTLSQDYYDRGVKQGIKIGQAMMRKPDEQE